jgi:hypothetical protein
VTFNLNLSAVVLALAVGGVKILVAASQESAAATPVAATP